MTAVLDEPMAAVSEWFDTLRSSLSGMDDGSVVQALRAVERVSRQAMAAMLEVVAEIDSRGIGAAEGFGTTERFVGAVLRLSGAQARERAEQARLLGTRRSVVGEPLPPRLPATSAALADGRLGAGQLRVITETMNSLPVTLPEPVRAQAESDLAGYAADFDPRRLRTIAARVIAHCDPDGPAPDESLPPERQARGELWLRDRRDGRLDLRGWLDAEHGALLRTVIDQLAEPRPEPDGSPDLRGVAARQADALIDLTERARAGGDLAASGGEPPHLSVLIDYEALRTGLGTASLDRGQRISAADARRLACDAAILPLMLGSDSAPLDVGRAMRTVPRSIRRALVARDRGCSFPGCHRPPARCAAHHVRHWADGGTTCVDNCCLLCDHHHLQVHRQGWDITIRGGRVEFRPPPSIDPNRKPLTNPLRR